MQKYFYSCFIYFSAFFIVFPAHSASDLLDIGTDSTSQAFSDVNMITASTEQTKVAEEAIKIKEAKAVKKEVESVIGKQGRRVVGYRDFFYPTYHGMPLSYCTVDHKTCGQALASRYCGLLGYERASKTMIDHNVGLTRYVSTNLQCQGWQCDSFKLITCEKGLRQKPTPVYYYRMRDFVLPRFQNYRIDWCYQEKKGCGRRAANAFCRQKGYDRAKSYQQSSTKVASTRTIGSGALCFGQTCKGFENITCYR